ncbi:hypothetical protein Mlg_2400 [Alkalilimnicola ehrlichii MLHE-1]|uniref:Uncharacterized protein n=1 Tax=Alkalilimnicola ehrlichii (strain ATCC BAA-1101 / DSM 17681 / MLHE-1) TaxID=187272 RepID=Q0A5Z7_ALKEH|nr:hypothetical protein Mlg_2400 [Alkalilimnicola ehrlichii MLHE-1]
MKLIRSYWAASFHPHSRPSLPFFSLLTFVILGLALAGCSSSSSSGDPSDEEDNGFSVSVNVRGLDLAIDPGTPLILNDQAEEALTIEADGSYAFSAELASGDSYGVEVTQQPNEPRQFCFIERQQAVSGEITGDVTLNVDCGLAYHGLFPGWGVGATPDDGSLRPLQIAPATLVALRVDGQDEIAVVDPCQVETRGEVTHADGTYDLSVTAATACDPTLFLNTTMTEEAFTAQIPEGIDELPDELELSRFAGPDRGLPTAALGHAVADAEAQDLLQHNRWLLAGLTARQADAMAAEELHGTWGLVALTMELNDEAEPQWVRHSSLSVPAIIGNDGNGDLLLNADGWQTLTAAVQAIQDDPPPPPITQGFTQGAPGDGFSDVPLTLSADGRLQAGDSHGFVSADGDFFVLIHSEPTPEQVRADEENGLGEGQGAHQVLLGVRRDENLVSLDGRTYALFGPSWFLGTEEDGDSLQGVAEFELAPFLEGTALSFSEGEVTLTLEEEQWIAPFGGGALDIDSDSDSLAGLPYTIGDNEGDKPQLIEIDLGDGFGPDRDNYLTGYAHGKLLVLALGVRDGTQEEEAASLSAEINLLGLITLSADATVNGDDDAIPAEDVSVGTLIGICVQGCNNEF